MVALARSLYSSENTDTCPETPGVDRSYTYSSRHRSLTKLLVTPRSRGLLEKLTVSQLVKKFLAFSGAGGSLPHSQQPATCPYLSQLNPVHAQSHFKIHFNIILPSTPGSPKWSPSLRSPQQSPVCTSLFPYVLHAPSISFLVTDYTDIFYVRLQTGCAGQSL
jgi:hypothetical protein